MLLRFVDRHRTEVESNHLLTISNARMASGFRIARTFSMQATALVTDSG